MFKLNNPEWVDDTKRVRRAIENIGYDVSLAEAERVWEGYSESMCAGWMRLPDDDSQLEEIVAGGLEKLND
jgi:hypothetical protein